MRAPQAGRLAALVAASEALVWVADAQGRFAEAQPSWQAYTGQARDACAGMGWLEAIHPDDRRGVLLARAAAEGDAQFRCTFRLWHGPSGRYGWVASRCVALRDAAGAGVREWICAARGIPDDVPDLPELLAVRDALLRQIAQQSEELERLFCLSPDIIMCLDAGGFIQTVSAAFEKVTGIPPVRVVGMHCTRFSAPQDADRINAGIAAVLAGQPTGDVESDTTAADGAIHTVSWRAVFSPGARRIYAIGRDITRQKLAEQRQVQAQRLEAIGQITGGVAHDFNNVLAAMMGYIEVAMRANRDERVGKALSSVLDAGRRGTTLVAQLLNFARKRDVALQPVDLNALVRELKPLIEQAARGQASFDLRLAPDLPAVTADPTRLEMVVLNLCLNARDALPGSGQVVLRTSVADIDAGGAAMAEGLAPGRYGLLSVIDQGAGMDAATLAHCFEPFFTTKGPGRGTGLGLSQSLSLVQQCGGAIRVESVLQQGTRVDVLLPLAPRVPAGPASAPAATRVLVVDDDADVLDATAAMLEALGYATCSAASGQVALAILGAGEPVDAVLSDLNMPQMDGIELLARVSLLRPDLCLVLMTGGIDAMRPGGRAAGLTVLSKPLRVDALLQALPGTSRPDTAGPGLP